VRRRTQITALASAITIAAAMSACRAADDPSSRSDRGAVALIETGWTDVSPAEVVELPEGDLLGGDLLGGELPEPAAGQVVLVNFWASTCPPCRDEMPLLQELHEQGEVLVVGVTRDRFRENAREALDLTGVTYPNVQDFHGDYAATFHGVVPLSAIPTTALLVDGKAVRIHIGPFDDRAAIESGLSDLSQVAG
jgi:thiol-disulfide isomerase/thioredoxin